jgi:glucose-1-phosphate thymidylyltransferase
MGKKNIILRDLDLLETRPLSRLRTIFSQRNGAFTEIERVKQQFPEAEIYFYHPNKDYENIVSRIDNLIPYNSKFETKDIEDYDSKSVIKSENHSPFKILDSAIVNINKDFALLYESEKFLAKRKKNFFTKKLKLEIYGEDNLVIVHKSAKILPLCVFDTTEGCIIIDEGAEISSFSYLKGPLYVGKYSKIDKAQIKGGCVIGHNVRLGGEVESSLINDFSNKHHEGFLGHSILGSWVNLGALTTTSDLKNNYGEVRINIPKSFFPMKNETLTTIPTGVMKFGAIIGDCVKTAIGTMLGTGIVLDCGSNIFGGSPDKYLSPFSWGFEGKTVYEPEKFILDCEKIFKRRNQKPSELFGQQVRSLIENLK